MEDMKNFELECGNRCKRVRMIKGLTQEELAEKMGVSAKQISKLENKGIRYFNDIK